MSADEVVDPALDGPVLLARFDGLDWAPGPVEAWWGAAPPEGLPVLSACALVTVGDELLLVDVRSRGWDLPGGHLEPGESAPQAVLRELDEEAGVSAGVLEPPRLLGWFRVGTADRLPDGRPVTQDSAMLVYLLRLPHGPAHDRATRVPREIAAVATFPLDHLPGSVADRIWLPYLSALRDGRSGP